jgi:hypothetical protein
MFGQFRPFVSEKFLNKTKSIQLYVHRGQSRLKNTLCSSFTRGPMQAYFLVSDAL